MHEPNNDLPVTKALLQAVVTDSVHKFSIDKFDHNNFLTCTVTAKNSSNTSTYNTCIGLLQEQS